MRTKCSRSAAAAFRKHWCPASGARSTPRPETPWSVTPTSSSRFLNELRFGWMHVTGGQVSAEPRRGLRQPGRPAGRNERSARHGLSADLDARSLQHLRRSHHRSPIADNSTSRCTRTCCSTAARIASSSAATSFTCSSGPSSPTTRAARSPTRVSSLATRSPISSSDIRRRRSLESDAAMRTAGPTGSTCSHRTTGRVRSNLTLNLGLRYEYNQHMRDEANRLSSVDFETPGGRFVIASDEDGSHQRRGAGRCCR